MYINITASAYIPSENMLLIQINLCTLPTEYYEHLLLQKNHILTPQPAVNIHAA